MTETAGFPEAVGKGKASLQGVRAGRLTGGRAVPPEERLLFLGSTCHPYGLWSKYNWPQGGGQGWDASLAKQLRGCLCYPKIQTSPHLALFPQGNNRQQLCSLMGRAGHPLNRVHHSWPLCLSGGRGCYRIMEHRMAALPWAFGYEGTFFLTSPSSGVHGRGWKAISLRGPSPQSTPSLLPCPMPLETVLVPAWPPCISGLCS